MTSGMPSCCRTECVNCDEGLCYSPLLDFIEADKGKPEYLYCTEYKERLLGVNTVSEART